jgi:HEAT repeat protein
MSLAASKIPACSRIFKRLNAGEWYVTKHVQTFASAEMHDLEFELALPALAGLLPEPGGSAAAQLLSELGPEAHAFLFRSCGSTNGTERLNAVSTLRSSRPPAYGDVIPRLLKDDNPAVRLIVLQAIENGSDDRFVESALELLRDPHIEIRSAATGYLMGHERPERTPFYLALMEDHDPNVRMHAIGIATWINRYSPSDAVFFEALRRLKDPDENVQASALQALHQMNPRIPVAREHLLPFLTSSFADVNSLALGMLRLPMRSGNQPTYDLSSFEAAALITNRLTMARLQGLKVLQQNADATAVELMLPLLADNNKLVRNRAFCVLRSITGDDASENDPSKWRAWWEANKSSFKSRKPGQ